MVNFKEIWKLLKATVAESQFKQVSLLASSLAYYTVFSLAPVMIIIITIVGAIFGEAAAKGEVVGRIQGVVDQQGAQVIETAIANIQQDTSSGSFRLIFSLGFLIFGASTVFAQIQNALNKIWEVKPEPGLHLLDFIRKRLLSFAMVLVIAFLLLVSLVVNTALATLVSVLKEFLPDLDYLWQILSFLVSFGIVTVLFAAMYTILPDARVAWRDALVGAIITAVLFMLGQFLFGLFLSHTSFGSAYGVAGSFIIIITWIYYAAHILFLGAEFTQVYARRHGSPIVPEEHAVSISSNDENDETRSQASYQRQDSKAGQRERDSVKRSYSEERASALLQADRSGRDSSSQQTTHRRQRNSENLFTTIRQFFTRIFQKAGERRNRRR